MGEAGPTRNRKSGGRAQERGRQGGARRPDPKVRLGLGDHRKSNSQGKGKERPRFWEGTHSPQTTPGVGAGALAGHEEATRVSQDS